jgi:hypothetical protein
VGRYVLEPHIDYIFRAEVHFYLEGLNTVLTYSQTVLNLMPSSLNLYEKEKNIQL